MMRKPDTRARQYWTRERVIDGLRRYYQAYGRADNSSVMQAQTRDQRAGSQSAFPPQHAIFVHFDHIWQAWEATGLNQARPRCQGEDCRQVFAWRDYLKKYCKGCQRKRQSQQLRQNWNARGRKFVFSEALDEQIRDLYNLERRKNDTARIKRFAEEHQLPRYMVTKRARELGVLRPRQVDRFWSNEEIRILEEFSYMTVANIRLKLLEAGFKRSMTAITMQIQRSQTRRLGEYLTTGELAKLIGEDPHKIKRWTLEGLLPATGKGKRRGRELGDIRVYHTRDIYHFLVTERERWDIRKVNQDWLLSMLIDYPATEGIKTAPGKWDLSEHRPRRKRRS